MDAGPAPELPPGTGDSTVVEVRMILSVPFPASAMSNMRLTMRDASGSISRVGRFLGPCFYKPLNDGCFDEIV